MLAPAEVGLLLRAGRQQRQARVATGVGRFVRPKTEGEAIQSPAPLCGDAVLTALIVRDGDHLAGPRPVVRAASPPGTSPRIASRPPQTA